MSLANLSIEQIEEAIRLLQEKKALLEKLHEVEIQLDRVIDNRPLTPRVPDNASPSLHLRKRGRKSILQASILHALQAAGPQGLSMKELAVKTKGNESSIRVWIYTVGKKTIGLHKVAPGRYAYTATP